MPRLFVDYGFSFERKDSSFVVRARIANRSIFFPTTPRPLFLARTLNPRLLLGPLATFSTTTMSQTRALTRSTTALIARSYGPNPQTALGKSGAHQNVASVGASVGKTLGQGVCELPAAANRPPHHLPSIQHPALEPASARVRVRVGI